jgi:GNAT superfamily N-acetyltransferase
VTRLESALLCAARGWAVIPLKPGTKIAAVPWKFYQHNAPSLDTIRAWWNENPDYNIGLLTGRVSNLYVVDVDPRNGGSVEETARITPTGCMVKTGGGGMHFYCTHPTDVPTKPAIRPGVDLKGEGGYVVGPGSTTDADYEWVAQGEPAPLPEWCFEPPPRPAGAAAGAGDDKEPWIADALAFPENVPSGEQDETLSRLAWYFSRSTPQDIAQSVLTNWVARLPLGRPREPWTAEHVKEKLDRAYEKRRLEPAVTVFEFVDDRGKPAPRPDSAEKIARALAACQTARELGLDETAQSWLVPDFIAPGCYTEIIGLMKLGKSTLICDIIRAAVHGAHFLGRPCVKTPVVYMSEQGGPSLRATLERGRLLAEDDLYLMGPRQLFGLSWPERFAASMQLAERTGAKIIIIDTFAKLALLAGDQENSAGAIMQALQVCEAARAKGIGLVFIRHARKMVEDDGVSTAGRGSGAITGDMDICVLHSKPKHHDLRILQIKSRLSEPDDIWLKYQSGSYVETAQPDSARRRQWVETHEKITTARAGGDFSVRKLAEMTGLSPTTVHTHLTVEKEGDGFGTQFEFVDEKEVA